MKTELDKSVREALITYRLEKATIREIRPRATQFIQAVRQLITA